MSQVDVTVLIATYRRALSLKETLLDLAAQDTRGDFNFEVIVINNNSFDYTRLIVHEIQRKGYPVRLRYYFEPMQGKHHALNTGMFHAEGRIFVFTDDDTRLAPNWLWTIYQAFEKNPEIDGVGGPIRPLWQTGRPKWLSDNLLKQLGMVDYGNADFTVHDPKFCFVGPNCAYRRHPFQLHGGYVPDHNLDVELFLRFFRAGHKMMYAAEAGVLHKVDAGQMKISYFIRRFLNHGEDCAKGSQEKGGQRTFCRIPIWMVRYWFELQVKAIKGYSRNQKDEALWDWLRSFFYWGAITTCFHDWLLRKPHERPRPAIEGLAAPIAAEEAIRI